MNSGAMLSGALILWFLGCVTSRAVASCSMSIESGFEQRTVQVALAPKAAQNSKPEPTEMSRLASWLLQEKDFVGWILLVFTAMTAVFGNLLQARAGLAGIQKQLDAARDKEAAIRSERSAVFKRCLQVDVGLLSRKIDSVTDKFNDLVTGSATDSWRSAAWLIPIPDTISGSWEQLASLPVEIAANIRQLYADLSHFNTRVEGLEGKPQIQVATLQSLRNLCAVLKEDCAKTMKGLE